MKEALGSLEIKTNLQNGFRKCGLHPFNPDAVNYSKVLSKRTASTPDTVLETEMTTSNVEAPNTAGSYFLKHIEDQLEPDVLEEFRLTGDGEWVGEAENKNLFYLWRSTMNIAHFNVMQSAVEASQLEVNIVPCIQYKYLLIKCSLK